MDSKELPKQLPPRHQWKNAEPHPNFRTMNQECFTVLRQEKHVNWKTFLDHFITIDLLAATSFTYDRFLFSYLPQFQTSTEEQQTVSWFVLFSITNLFLRISRNLRQVFLKLKDKKWSQSFIWINSTGTGNERVHSSSATGRFLATRLSKTYFQQI